MLRIICRFAPPVALFLLLAGTGGNCHALTSVNLPLDSPGYGWLDKLAGMGLIRSDLRGLRPFSRGEVARLLLEAENNLPGLEPETEPFAADLLKRLRELVPREVALRGGGKQALFDLAPLQSLKISYVWLDGLPRSYVREVKDPAHQSAFGFIGGDLRPLDPGITHTTGTEGTPLLENSEGTIYSRGHNASFRWSMEGFFTGYTAFLVEPQLLHTAEADSIGLQKGYLKIGGGGLELEIGRDANWFGPGYRGALTLTSNARNFDSIKLSSPEPVEVDLVRRYLGDFKYAFIFSRFDATGSGDSYRRPWFIGVKLALKPTPWFEIGGNLVRQDGGPGFQGEVSLKDRIFGGADNDHINAIAGIDLRCRIPALRNTELYGEYSGEDSASFWPIVESYVAGIFIPSLSASGRDDLRFEYYWGSVMAYGDWQFPDGYVYHNMTPGHSQGGAAQEFFVRYSHWFSSRHNIALEYFNTERGVHGRLPGQVSEQKNAARGFWQLPLFGGWNAGLMYGWEHIRNLNLVPGPNRTNSLFKFDLSYRY